MAVVGTCLPHALLLHLQNSPQMDTSGQEKEGTTKRDMAVLRGERPQYQGLSLDMAPVQQQTEPDGEPMLSPYMPDGAERMSDYIYIYTQIYVVSVFAVLFFQLTNLGK